MSPPAAIRAAEDKALQLATAADVGLNVPATMWTNDRTSAESHLTTLEGGIVKSTTTAHWEERVTSHFVFAHAVTVEDLPSPGRLAASPLAFQQRIEPKRDVRVTVVGDLAFAAVTDDASGEQPDWRLAEETTWTAYELRDDVRRRCLEVVQRLGLRFGGIDLLVDRENRHWFCELNPNGEWGWLEKVGLPIADALASELIGTIEVRPKVWQRFLLSKPMEFILPTATTLFFNHHHLTGGLPTVELPAEPWAQTEAHELLKRSEDRLRSLEGKGPGLAIVAAGVVAAIVEGGDDASSVGRLLLAIAAWYSIWSLIVPIYLVGPQTRATIDVEDLADAAGKDEPEQHLAVLAQQASQANVRRTQRIANLQNAARTELTAALGALSLWLLLGPAVGLL